MATAGRGTPADLTTAAELSPVSPLTGPEVDTRAASATAGAPMTVAQRLFAEAPQFGFFQAVRLLEQLQPDRVPVGRDGPFHQEIVRFRAHLSLSFAPSEIYEIEPPSGNQVVTTMTVWFMGLTGPQGILPRHYTELLYRLQRDAKGSTRTALRDWLDLFNHRLISLFYRAWEKYRFWRSFERDSIAWSEDDKLSQSLFSLIGHGIPPLQNRLRISVQEEIEEIPTERLLGRVDDLALLYYGGLLAHRPRNAIGLEQLLRGYFQMPVRVRQFQGQWLLIDPTSRTHVGGGNCELGVSAMAGDRIWDVQSKVRVCIGPLGYTRFNDLLPDRRPMPHRTTFFLFCQLIRLYVGMELDFEIQLVLRADEVPQCQLSEAAAVGPCLGWNTWVHGEAFPHDADDAVFQGEDVIAGKVPRP